MSGPALWDVLRPRRQAMVDALGVYVRHESPSREKRALDALAGVIAERLRALGGAVERVENMTGGDHVLARWWPNAGPSPPALVVGHYDTVWPLGTLARQPFRVEGDRAFGPGAFDMKASLVMVEEAVRALRALGLEPPRPVVVLLNSDEEVGSPTSRRLIEEQARQGAYALVLEPPLPGGGLKTARKGVGKFVLSIEGRPAHAGIEPEKGVSAVLELAHQILAIHGLADPAAGTSLNVGVVQGGTTSNTIPAQAVAQVDLRVSRLDEAHRVERALHALRPVLPGARVTVTGGIVRPPMERTPAIAALFARAREVGRPLGLDLTEGATGGASDGNFTAALGVPTLDGLGAVGAGAHAEDEHVSVDSIVERAALLAALLLEL